LKNEQNSLGDTFFGSPGSSNLYLP